LHWRRVDRSSALLALSVQIASDSFFGPNLSSSLDMIVEQRKEEISPVRIGVLARLQSGFAHMDSEKLPPIIAMDELLRMFAIQEKPHFMFLLGAGCSSGAGIPTAAEMVWMFKREIYCSRTATSPNAFRDLTVKQHQVHLQKYFDSIGSFPPLGSDNEYSEYFKACYPKSEQRTDFIRKYIKEGRPTIGHECLAVLLAQSLCNWVWTPNFDDLIERAERPDSPRRLSHVGPDTRAHRIESGLEPMLVKLHGDYRYDALKNTSEELRSLDDNLRQHLIDRFHENGLLVVGYSGRDESVMSALTQALKAGNLTRGIFWCIREDVSINERVPALVNTAIERTGSGGLVQINSFDDLFFRLYRQCNLNDSGIDSKAQLLFESRSPFDLGGVDRGEKPLKTNGIRVASYPSTPFSFLASLTSWKELREIIAGKDIVAGFFAGKVFAFGDREQIRAAFKDRLRSPIETGSIQTSDFEHTDSVMLGLLYDVITASLVRDYGLLQAGNREHRLFFIPVGLPLTSTKHSFSFEYKKQRYEIPYAQKKSGFVFNEAFSFQLEQREEALWFVLQPSVVVTVEGRTLAPIEKRRLANVELSTRFNRTSYERLLFWHSYLRKVADPIVFSFPTKSREVCRIELDSDYAYSFLRMTAKGAAW
jgi:NAD-dependent SIR2 family protein deacetylase